MYSSYFYDKCHDQKQLEEKTYFSMWFQRNRVHHGEEGMVWCQKQEADRAHIICTQETDKGRAASGMGYKLAEHIPSDVLVQ